MWLAAVRFVGLRADSVGSSVAEERAADNGPEAAHNSTVLNDTSQPRRPSSPRPLRQLENIITLDNVCRRELFASEEDCAECRPVGSPREMQDGQNSAASQSRASHYGAQTQAEQQHAKVGKENHAYSVGPSKQPTERAQSRQTMSVRVVN